MNARSIGTGALAGAVLAACAAAAPIASAHTIAQKKPIGPSVSLKFETYNTTTDPVTLWANDYARKVARDSGGAVQITVYPNSELVSQAGAAQALETGAIPIGFTGLPSVAPTSAAENGVDLPADPYESVGYAATKAAMQSLKVRGLLNAALKNVNLELIGNCIQGQNAIISNIPQENLAEMAGVKTRAASTNSAADISAYGGNPVVVPIASTYQAFLLHTVSAAVSNYANDYGYSWYQVAKYINPIAIEYTEVSMFINTQALSSMNKAEQKVVVSDALATAPSCDAAEQKYNLTVLHAMEQQGTVVTGFDSKADAAAFKARFAQRIQQSNSSSPLAETLSKVFAQLNKQYKA